MLRAVTLFILLNLLDLAGTIYLLGHASGAFYELNPIARLCLYWAGWQGISALKVFGASLAGGIGIYISHTHPIVAIRMLDAFSATVAATCLWSGLIYLTGGMIVAGVIAIGIAVAGLVIYAFAWLLSERKSHLMKIRTLEADLANWQSLATGHTQIKIFSTETFV